MAENDKVPKFGRGQYESALRNEAPPSVKHARSYFLDVVKTLAPTVLEDLGASHTSSTGRRGSVLKLIRHQGSATWWRVTSGKLLRDLHEEKLSIRSGILYLMTPLHQSRETSG